MRQKQVPEALPLLLSGHDDSSGLTMWGAELKLREMERNLPLQLQETTLEPAKAWGVPSLLRPRLVLFSRAGFVHTSTVNTDSREQRRE